MPVQVGDVWPVGSIGQYQTVCEGWLSERRAQRAFGQHLVLDTRCVVKVEFLVDGDQSCVKGDVVGRAGGETIPVVEAFPTGAVTPRFYVTRGEKSWTAASADIRAESAKHASVLVITKHAFCETVLPHTHGGS